ncbi:MULTISPECIES: CGNR zinc finger domain-containing protein [Nocardioides]|uniref:CGNR zinc finger domain-containing protein n=1 Tax=Nocardioides vastitatis TaxID=2568655 RepID=A0ABW0ZBU0_9ACTN|nr:CGNR zinc finger domain-containing protein [Nocardioides sp.]THJ03810.1 RNA-binding protein [Nocardioides sp.]
MIFAHDTEMALQAAVALVNSAEEPETLQTVADLDAFLRRFGYTGRHDRDEAELESVRRVRPRLRGLLAADRDGAVEVLNAMLAEARAVPRLVRHDEMDWHVHAVADDRPLAERILVETAMAMIDVVRADEMSRLGVCADPDCDGLVLDLSRNRSRRFCSTTCGNRAAVAAYRARQASR